MTQKKGHIPARKAGVSEKKAERVVQALKLRQRGYTYDDIGKALGIAKSIAHGYVKDAMRQLAEDQTEETQQLRALEVARLDEMSVQAYKVLFAKHYTINSGSVVYHNGAEVLDDAPVLRAIDRLLKISERRAKLLNLDLQKEAGVDSDSMIAMLREFAQRAPV